MRRVEGLRARRCTRERRCEPLRFPGTQNVAARMAGAQERASSPAFRTDQRAQAKELFENVRRAFGAKL
jgi:hypothetical protein